MAVCHTCRKKRSKSTCGACREILKIDLVDIIMRKGPIYLDENNRHKESLLSKEEKEALTYQRLMYGTTFKQLGEDFGVSPALAHKVFHATKDTFFQTEPFPWNMEEDLSLLP